MYVRIQTDGTALDGDLMRAGLTLFFQSGSGDDWDRFEKSEKGADVALRPDKPDAEIWQEELRFGHLAEELGFDSLWTVEHHISPYAMTTNPLQLLAYFAGALERIDLGTMIVVLPWHNPLRVAEDLVLLENVLAGSGRHVKLGVGRGAGRREFAALNVDMNDSRALFNESVEILKLALTEDRFSYSGKHYQLENVELRPQPTDGKALVDNFYCSSGSPETIPIAAGYGLKPLIIPQKPWAAYESEMTQYKEVRAENGYGPAAPIIILWFYCAETEEEARKGAEQYLPEYGTTALKAYELLSPHFASLKGYEHYAEQQKFLVESADSFSKVMIDNHVWGTPEQCIEKIRQINESLRPEELVFAARYGSMTAEVAERSLRLFAEKVLPAVHEMPSAAVVDGEPVS